MPSIKKTPSRSYCGTMFFQTNDIVVSDIVKQEMYDKCDNMIGEAVTQRCKITYMVYQTEAAPSTGLHHIQWHCQTDTATTWLKMKEYWKRRFGDQHWFIACNGDSASNRKYCTKPESRLADLPHGEYGEFEDIEGRKGQGCRSELLDVQAAIADGDTWDILVSKFFGTCAKYPQFIQDRLEAKRSGEHMEAMKTTLADAVLRPWQAWLANVFLSDAGDRVVYWIHESVGNVGKSYFAKYMMVMHGVLVLKVMKKADMLHMIAGAIGSEFNGVIFDCCRTMEDGSINVVYEVVEMLKDGYICSGKYQSVGKVFKPPHVCVLANFAPDGSKLSVDRMRVHDLAQAVNPWVPAVV